MRIVPEVPRWKGYREKPGRWMSCVVIFRAVIFAQRFLLFVKGHSLQATVPLLVERSDAHAAGR